MSLDLKSFVEQVRITDGVYGTELQKQGLVSSGCTELLNVANAPAIEAIARSYVQAGSDVIMTNSLGANRFVLEAYDAAERATEIAEIATRLARQAGENSDVKIFGSFGSTGKVVMMGDVPEQQIREAFQETVQGLVRGGAEAIVLETFNELAEARIAIQAIQDVCALPVVVSMVFAFGPNQAATMMGETPADLARMAEECGADAVGANCGLGPDSYIEVTRQLRAATELPIWIKPNAGLPVVHEGHTTFPLQPEEFASFAPKLIEAGANFLGGCCGCGPDHIRALRKAVKTPKNG